MRVNSGDGAGKLGTVLALRNLLGFVAPLARYQNELAGVDTELLAERFYYQALSVAPQIGTCAT